MKKVTLEMIAKEIGTTKNTVSRAIRGESGVSDELRSKINYLASQYGYQRKHPPHSKNEQAPFKVTMVCNNFLPYDTYFWPYVMKGIFEYSARHQISTHTVIVDMIRDDIKYLLPLQEKHCDGILVIGTLPDSQFTRIAELGIPLVAVDHYNDNVKCDYVNVANQNGTIKAVNFLKSRGHFNIGFINNEAAPYTYSFKQRFLGYKTRMEQLGLPINPRFIWADSTYTDNQYFHQKLEQLTGDTPTAWICVNDLTAYNFCSVLSERGLRVPEDISVIGFDNIPGVFQTQLTTLGVPQNIIGDCALRRLVRRLRHPEEPFESIEIFTDLMDKGSVTPRT